MLRLILKATIFTVLLQKYVPIMDLGLVVSRVFLNLSSHISKQIVILLLSVMPSLLVVMQIPWRAWLEE